jgi:hypothetical protein
MQYWEWFGKFSYDAGKDLAAVDCGADRQHGLIPHIHHRGRAAQHIKHIKHMESLAYTTWQPLTVVLTASMVSFLTSITVAELQHDNLVNECWPVQYFYLASIQF